MTDRELLERVLEALEHGWIESGDPIAASIRDYLATPEQAQGASAEEYAALKKIEAAARNLCTVKGRHHSEIAMRKLMEACAAAETGKGLK
jgi:hypothetical protein